MHSIKKAARRQAWYNDYDDGDLTYNPFGRLNAHRQGRRVTDIEGGPVHGLHNVATENDAISPIEQRRRRAYSTDESEFQGPKRASTFPAELMGSLSLSEQEEKSGIEAKDHVGGDTSHSGVSPVQLDTSLQSAVIPNEPRRRPFIRLMPWKQDSSEELTQDDSSKPTKRFAHITLMGQIKAICGSWINVLLAFVPAGFAVYYTRQSPTTVFVVNFFAIIPISALLSYSIDELALYIGDTLQGILTITFSNAVQLISSIFLLKTHQIEVLKSSLLGAILQSVLLMPGLAFLLGGYQRKEQYFNVTVAQTMGMFLLLAVLSLTVPTVSQLWGHSTQAGIVAQSRGTAVVIMFSYLLWLIFQLRTHRDMFEEPGQKAPKKPSKPSSRRRSEKEAFLAMATTGGTSSAASGGAVNLQYLPQEPDEDCETVPQLTRIGALATIVISTTVLAFHTEFATNSIRGLLANDTISEKFVGIVILPLLSNDLNTIACGWKDKLDLSLALTVHRAMQTALLVAPLVVLIAWGMSIDGMTLDFDGFSAAALFASIIILTYILSEGKSNWLTGALLIKVFLIVGLASFYVK